MNYTFKPVKVPAQKDTRQNLIIAIDKIQENINILKKFVNIAHPYIEALTL